MIALAALATTACGRADASVATRELKVCADPNNLPFSNSRKEGFENRIADLIARDLDARVTYTWWAQRRGFIRNTLNAAKCDIVMGVPSSFELAAVTAPYYRSSYVFVSRKDREIKVTSFDDPALRKLRIGVQLIGDDGANTPPVHALSARNISGNVVGYMIYGDYRQPNPPARIIDAVIKGDVDIAIAWGPMAGYFASRQTAPLEIVPVSPQIDVPFLPLVFDISAAVRRTDVDLKAEIDAVLRNRRADIERILDEYSIPRLSTARVAASQ